jgi:hypothetical protein
LSGITPWISVEPNDVPGAILGALPMATGSITFQIPTSVVPSDATGMLVLTWVATSGANPGGSFWHFTVNPKIGSRNWFSMLVVGNPTPTDTVSYNSQAFWLPMPADGALEVTLMGAPLTGGMNNGQVEIHGYYPAGD